MGTQHKRQSTKSRGNETAATLDAANLPAASSNGELQEKVDKLTEQVGELEQALEAARKTPHRERLPNTRESVTHKFNVNGTEGYLTVGLYPDGRPGELFLRIGKEGSTLAGLCDTFAINFSMALQFGVPLEALVRKHSYSRFEPSGWTPNKDIRNATSIVDYIARWLGHRFSVDGFDKGARVDLADASLPSANEE